jgi:hypothetical protein
VQPSKGHRIIKDENKLDDLLCRKEFIELFLRLAAIEYPADPGGGSFLKPSYERFLEINFKSVIP